MTFRPFGAGTYQLAASIGSTDTTILLSSFLEPVTSTPYTMVLLDSDIAYATIAPKTTSAEFISFTGITQNANGTATLTGVTRGLAKKYPFTASASYRLPHSGQSQFIISDAPQLFNEYVTLDNAETIVGKKTFPAGGHVNAPVSGTVYAIPTDDLEYTSKKYVDNIAIAGSPLATTSVYGISKLSVAAASPTAPIVVGANDWSALSHAGITQLSVAPAVAATPIAVGTNDGRVPTQTENDALVGTSGTPSTSNPYVTSDDVSNAGASGKIVRLSGTSYPAGNGSAITGIVASTKVSNGTSAVTVTNTTTPTDLVSFTVPANTLGTNGAVQVIVNISDFDGVSTNTLTLDFKYGATTVFSITYTCVSQTNNQCSITFTLVGNAATNAQKGWATWSIFDLTGTYVAPSNVIRQSNGTATEDSTANKTLAITATWGTASVNNSITMNAYIGYKVI